MIAYSVLKQVTPLDEVVSNDSTQLNKVKPYTRDDYRPKKTKKQTIIRVYLPLTIGL